MLARSGRAKLMTKLFTALRKLVEQVCEVDVACCCSCVDWSAAILVSCRYKEADLRTQQAVPYLSVAVTKKWTCAHSRSCLEFEVRGVMAGGAGTKCGGREV